MTFVRKGILVAIFWTIIGPCAAHAQSATVDRLNSYLDQAHQAGLLNGNILIADHGKVVLRRAIGYADASRTVPLKLSDRLEIGSIAKEFDAVGILMLAQEGKLSLTDPVSKFLPDLPPWAATVTIDDLMHCTSGLPDIDWDTVHTDADAYRNLRALKQLDHPAGTHYAYNNNNTFLRRQVIEKISGMSFDEFITKREFPKAGIRDAVIDPTATTPRFAKSFDANFKQDPFTPFISGWTAVTVDDLFRWSNCMASFCLITPDSTRQLGVGRHPGWSTALGEWSVAGNQLMKHEHDGNNHNSEALLTMDASKGRTIIIETSQNDHVYALADAIDAILDGKPYVALSAVKGQ
jgi:D-alanyl-D-alanine carboxypeptidase